MKILFLTRLYWPHVGGVEKHIAEVIKRLRDKGLPAGKAGIKVDIITTKYDSSLKDKETVSGTEVYRFNQPEIKFVGLIYTWYWLYQKRALIKESDIVHIHDVFIWYWPFKILFPNKKVHVTFHGRWGRYPIPLNDILQKKIGTKLSN